MTTTEAFVSNDQSPISTIEPNVDRLVNENQLNFNKTRWTQRFTSYFTTNDGRIMLFDLLFTLICVILHHVMGTCYHAVSDGTAIVKWHVFTPAFGAGPHTAVFFFVLSWTTLAYCLNHMWVYLTTGIRLSKKRDLIVHGLIVILYFVALGFNIWGYVLCESASHVTTADAFSPGVCRGDSKTCIPLIAGVLAACATGCAFFAEHILALTHVLRNRQDPDESKTTRILP